MGRPQFKRMVDKLLPKSIEILNIIEYTNKMNDSELIYFLYDDHIYISGITLLDVIKLIDGLEINDAHIYKQLISLFNFYEFIHSNEEDRFTINIFYHYYRSVDDYVFNIRIKEFNYSVLLPKFKYTFFISNIEELNIYYDDKVKCHTIKIPVYGYLDSDFDARIYQQVLNWHNRIINTMGIDYCVLNKDNIEEYKKIINIIDL